MADPKFIPLAGQGNSHRDFQEAALNVYAKRQEVLAANIANADTPNYKARDLDFQSALAAAQARAEQQPVELKLTAAAHLPAKGLPPPGPDNLLYHTPNQASADGNTVEMDVERSKFAENAVHYEFAMQYLGNDYKDMIQLLNNLK
ncbi:MAG TPA: flagellar basal body rod protein FlgB [Azospira sp.]|nr:flagellar basal body rod protein FlgB [Azospira sp.]